METRWTLQAPNGWAVTVPESKVKETLEAFQSDRELTSEEQQKAAAISQEIFRRSEATK